MIATVLLSLALTNSQSAAAEVAPVQNTVELSTLPIAHYSCDLMRLDGSILSLNIHISGRRGYKDPQSGMVTSTDGKVLLNGKGAADFAGYQLSNFMDDVFASNGPDNAHYGKDIRMRIESTAYPNEQDIQNRFSIVITERHPSMPYIKAVGYCDGKFEIQKPLSIAETRAYLSK